MYCNHFNVDNTNVEYNKELTTYVNVVSSNVQINIKVGTTVICKLKNLKTEWNHLTPNRQIHKHDALVYNTDRCG